MVRRFGNQPGKVGLGCLFSIFLLVAGIWVGINVFEVYWRYYRLQDFVKEQAGFATLVDDGVIRRRLVAKADSLGVPLTSRDWDIRRGTNPPQIVIQAQYMDTVVIELLGFRKVWARQFSPGVRSGL